MPLERGRRLGPYEILGALGAGGMGEVYKARDTRLDRTVAIKVLSAAVARDPTLKERFEREARAVSSLNHPHICTLHDIGTDGGIDYMVMEHLEGETLSGRLERGPLPAADALRAAIQIADALDRAHRRGLVHRDLKPGNIFLTREGAKLLDFGLARATAGPGSVAARPGDTPDETPTMTQQLTAAGSIVGTFSYMAPEQLEGGEADARSDIFAFGAVLYQMLTGQRAFQGKNPASIIASILKEEPRPMAAIAPAVPRTLQRIVASCLAKDPDERHQSIHDLKRELQWIADAVGEDSQHGAAPGTAAAAAAGPRGKTGWIAAALLGAAAAAGWGLYALSTRPPQEPPSPTVRFSIAQPAGTTLKFFAASEPDLAISPDGRSIVFTAIADNGVQTLWLRPLDSLESHPLAGTEGGRDPFWSSDGRFVGFFAEDKLRKVPIQPGPVQTLCDAPDARGGAWTPSGVILVGSRTAGTGIMQVAESGGSLKPLTTVGPDEDGHSHQWPELLPDGRRFLFLSFIAGRGTRTVRLGSLDSPEIKTVVETGFPAAYMEPGYLVHVHGTSLVAQPFSAQTGMLSGEPVLVTDWIALAAIPGMVNFDVRGRAIAWRRTKGNIATQMTWLDREGREIGTVDEPASDVSLSLSDDGTRAAVGRIIQGGASGAATGELPIDIWVVDLQRRVATRTTFTAEQNDENPIWVPNKDEIVFASHREGPADIFRKAASGMGEEALVFRSSVGADRYYMGLNPHPVDVSPDGRLLLMHVVDSADNHDLAVMPMDGSAQPERFAATTFNEAQGQFSPDGRFIAYASDESGAMEVYVQPYPAAGSKWRISSMGGGQPRWRRDGGEIFYVDGQGTLMAATVSLEPSFTASAPVALIRGQFPPTLLNYYGGAHNYDVSADGRRFLINRVLESEEVSPIDVTLNWRP